MDEVDMKAIWFADFGPIGNLAEIRRWLLFSFPHPVEERGEMRVLSSGTWGIASRRYGHYGLRHWEELYDYYRRYDVLGNSGWRIMPDEYLHPEATMNNFCEWNKRFPDCSVVPVIQFRREHEFELYTALKQLEFYAPFKPSRICISNPAYVALEWREDLTALAGMVKRIIPGCWIHVLGAGWTPREILDYAAIREIDSIDSIAYYIDAKDGEAWYLNGRTELGRPESCSCPVCTSQKSTDWRGLALHNAWVAQELASRAMLV